MSLDTKVLIGLMHQLFYGDFPKAFIPNHVTKYTNLSEYITKGVFPNTPNETPYNQQSTEAFAFIYSILSKKDPIERPSIEEVLQHPFLTQQKTVPPKGGSSKEFIKLNDKK